jgi:hypothetical protein
MSYRKQILIFVGISLLTACTLFDDGDNILQQEVYNLNRSKKAILFLKEGNATTDNSLHISILQSNESLNASDNGNVLTADSNRSKVSLGINVVKLDWRGNDTLIVEMNKDLRTFVKKTQIEGVIILYKVFGSP